MARFTRKPYLDGADAHGDREGTCETMKSVLGGLVALLLLGGCARHQVVLDLQGSILYEKPEISGISYQVDDQRRSGGGVTVSVDMLADPGLDASFDILPGIADHHPMDETTAGRYAGRVQLPQGTIGGPFSVIGRVRHDRAGETTMRDPSPLTISLIP